ncbi:MAG: sulfotransferase [Hyphomicrobiales bacterium]|nr:sulfotransferase [Hyphomicrobiales bacterium]
MRWLILGGCPRSGTTGLMDSLNQDPNIGLIPEYNSGRLFQMADAFFYKEQNVKRKSWVGDINLNTRGDATVLTKRFIKYVPQKDRTRDHIIETLYKTTFGKDCKLFGEKFPLYWNIDIDYVIDAVTKVQIIQILRNPRDVIRSYLHRRWLKMNNRDIWPYTEPEEGFRHWIAAWEALEHFSGDQRLELLPIKYEDLLTKDAPYEQIGTFLNLDSTRFQRLEKGKPREDTNLDVTFEYDHEIEAVFGNLLNDWNEPLTDLLVRYPPNRLRDNFERVFKTPFDIAQPAGLSSGDLLDTLVRHSKNYHKRAPKSFRRSLSKRAHKALKHINGWRRKPA